jgi:hypothetical protein
MPASGARPLLDVLNKPQRAKSDRYRRQTGIRTFLINGETLLHITSENLQPARRRFASVVPAYLRWSRSSY